MSLPQLSPQLLDQQPELLPDLRNLLALPEKIIQFGTGVLLRGPERAGEGGEDICGQRCFPVLLCGPVPGADCGEQDGPSRCEEPYVIHTVTDCEPMKQSREGQREE